MRDCWIYGLHNGDGEIRYIGKTIQSLRVRLNAHRTDSKRKSLPVNRWVAKHGRYNIEMVLLDFIAGGIGWEEKEAAWIAACNDSGMRLLNLLKGGDHPYVPFTRSEEYRKNLSERLRTGRHIPCAQCGTPVWVTPSKEKLHKTFYCNRECQGLSQRGKRESRPFPPQAAEARRARNARITHCPRGHPYSGDNLFVDKRGCRSCKICIAAHTRKYRKAKKENPKKWCSECDAVEYEKGLCRKHYGRWRKYKDVNVVKRPPRVDFFGSVNPACPDRWRYETCKAEALKYSTRYDFGRNSKGAYSAARKNGVLDEICAHMTPAFRWTKEALAVEANKYQTRGDFKRTDPAAYNAAIKRRILKEIAPHLTSRFIR